MVNDTRCQSDDYKELERQINLNPNTSTLRKCSGYYWRAPDGKPKKVEFELGCFHQFGNDFEEFESGAGNYTTAIVEMPDGKLVSAVIDSIRFLE